MSVDVLNQQHASPGDFAAQVEELKDWRRIAFLREIEIMFMELQSLLDKHPSVMAFSYCQNGDVSAFPIFQCLDEDGNEIIEEIEGFEALAEEWNSRTGAAVERFLCTQEERVFHRQGFEEDVLAGCKTVKKEEPWLDDGNVWLPSFISHLKAITLDRSTPKPSTNAHPSRRI